MVGVSNRVLWVALIGKKAIALRQGTYLERQGIALTNRGIGQYRDFRQAIRAVGAALGQYFHLQAVFRHTAKRIAGLEEVTAKACRIGEGSRRVPQLEQHFRLVAPAQALHYRAQGVAGSPAHPAWEYLQQFLSLRRTNGRVQAQGVADTNYGRHPRSGGYE